MASQQHSPNVGGLPQSHLRLVLLGSVGAEKSAVALSLLGRENWKDRGMCVKKQGEVAGRTVTMVDTPGWDRVSVKRTEDQIKKEIVRSVTLCPPGPHALILVVPTKQLPGNERKSIQHHMELLSKRVWKHTLVLFVSESEEEDRSLFKQAMESARNLLEKCGGRHHVLCGSTSNRTQVSELLQKIETMVEEESDEFFLPQVYYDLMESRMPRDVAVLRRTYEDREEKLKQRHKLQLKEMEDELSGSKTQQVPAEGMSKRRNSNEIDHPNMSTEEQDEQGHQKMDLEAVREAVMEAVREAVREGGRQAIREAVRESGGEAVGEAVREGGREAGKALMKHYVKPISVIITVVMMAFVGAIAGAQNGPKGAFVGSLFGILVGILVSYAVREAATAARGDSPTSPVQSKHLGHLTDPSSYQQRLSPDQ